MAASGNIIPIDPVLLLAESRASDQAITAISSTSSLSVDASDNPPLCSYHGELLTEEELTTRLEHERRKQPIRDACQQAGVYVPQSANLQKLKSALIGYHFPATSSSSTSLTIRIPPTIETRSTTALPVGPSSNSIELNKLASNVTETNDARLVEEFGIAGACSEDVLGYDNEDLDADADEENDNGDDLAEGVRMPTFANDQEFLEYQLKVRVEASRRAEMNRRIGGIRTQQAVVKSWNEFVEKFKEEKRIRDAIVDEHSLLLFIQYSAERPKRTRQGIDIPGTYVGAAHLKKLFFGALRIRKQQVAENPELDKSRPATSIIVWDAIKNRMNEALNRARRGLVPSEDAPDIIANTFLSEVTQDQLDKIGDAFLSHRLLRSTIYGHLAWTAQHASGNRGDDLRALKLAELQPWVMTHPNKETKIPTILGLQGEEKAGRKGMRTVINPVYTVFIAHRDPTKCPLGAFMFYFHYIHDVVNITEKVRIDWSLNKSWREARVLSGPGSQVTPLSEQSFYNMYVKAFEKAGFVSKVKAHLPRHLLGYRQESDGVDPHDTAKMGWVRGETYFDTYQPSIPKAAVLAAHGYRVHENYDPIWRHVHVPERFLPLVCPMAEGMISQLEGQANLVGAANHWKMIRDLRACFFQCGAAVYQRCPESPLFKLPAFANSEVRDWMKTSYPAELHLLEVAESQSGSIDLARIQDGLMRNSLEDVRSLLAAHLMEVKELKLAFLRRTAPLSPVRGYSNSVYGSSFVRAMETRDECVATTASPPVYIASDASPRAFVNASPKTPNTRREKTQVDLVLPDISAFCEKRKSRLIFISLKSGIHITPDAPQLIWPPILGQKAVTWPDIFMLVKQPHLFWDAWKPSKTLDQYLCVEDLWTCFTIGEPVFDDDGTQTGVRPPLQLVEQHFHHRWRTGSDNDGARKKAWQRFRKIPEWLNMEANYRGVSPITVIHELEEMRKTTKGKMGLNALMREVKKLWQERALQREPLSTLPTSSIPPMMTAQPHSATPLGSPVQLATGKRKRATAVGARTRPRMSKN